MKRLVLLLLFPLLANAQVVNQCIDAKGKTTFSDLPCKTIGMFTRKTVDGSNMSRADGIPRVNYIDQHGEVNNRPQGWYDKEPTQPKRVATGPTQHEIDCLEIKRNKEHWENAKSEQGRRNAAEYRYQYSKNNCHLVVRDQ